MAAALPSEDAAAVAAMTERIARLEAEILINGTKPTKRALSAQVLGAAKQLKKIGDENAEIKKLWASYDGIQKQLEALNGLLLGDKLMAPDVRELIVLAGEDHLRATAAQFEALGGLAEYTNTAVLQELPGLAGKLRPLETVQLTQQQTQAEQSERVVALLASYNAITELLSAKFVYWDAALTEAEGKVARALAERA